MNDLMSGSVNVYVDEKRDKLIGGELGDGMN